MVPLNIETYFQSLYARRHSAARIRHRSVSIGDWVPERNRCHANVDHFVKLNQCSKAVRGWMIISEDANGRCWFEAHSVIEEQGELLDITLPDQAACNLIRFLRHVGTEEEFWKIAIDGGHRQMLYPPLTHQELRNADFEEDD